MNFQIAHDQVVRLETTANFVPPGTKQMSWLFIFLSRKAITKHIMTGPMRNNEFCFPVTLNVPLGFVLGNI